ncbi:MAG: N-acetyltransferase, partial [Gammaproteobacteria bacterium]|nr:N-acetyltransferase [Gammaproteobacteria bacterium]
MDDRTGVRVVKAVHGLASATGDPAYISGFAAELREQYSRDSLLELYGRFAQGCGAFDRLMRRVIVRALARACGDGLTVEPGVGFKHP